METGTAMTSNTVARAQTALSCEVILIIFYETTPLLALFSSVRRAQVFSPQQMGFYVLNPT